MSSFAAGNASASASATANLPDPAKMPPSTKSFYDDPTKPAGAIMDTWNEQRNILYFMGKPYEQCVSIRGRVIKYTDKRVLLFSMAKKMNLIQEYYGVLYSIVGLQSRLMVEAFCAFFGPKEGFPDRTMVGAQMGLLKNSNPELTQILDNEAQVLTI